jgi:hypothetical protein
MNGKISFGITSSGSTSYHKDKVGRLEFVTRKQAGQEVYYDRANHRIGYLDSLGRTMTANNKVLNSQPRPDLILSKLPHRKRP